MVAGVGAALRGFGKALTKTPKKKSDFKLKNTLKRIQKTPDKNFKSYLVQDYVFLQQFLENSFLDVGTDIIGKKTYKSDVTKYHRAHQRMGLIKD